MERQMSDSIPCGIILALSGGCMDAYSYLFRGHVFANAQTGNILLFGVNLANQNWAGALVYFWPILAFTLGIVLSDVVNHRQTFFKMHWRQIGLIIEIIFLTAVIFLGEDLNPLANAMISFACGIQVESFRKIHGNAIATTMCIGNLRSGTFNLDKFFHTHERDYLHKAFLYYGTIIAFVIGAVAESILIKNYGKNAIILSPALLLIAFIIMFKGENTEEA